MAEETQMGCWMFLRNPSSLSRRGYKSLKYDGYDSISDEPAVTVVVGKEKRVFLVDPDVLKKDPFRILMGMMGKEEEEEKKKREVSDFKSSGGREVIFVGVDAILFEHMLWLVQNDCSSMFQLDFEEIIEFYAQD